MNDSKYIGLDVHQETIYVVCGRLPEMAISLGCQELLIGSCEGMLALVPISGGAPREVAQDVLSADWTADGSEIATVHRTRRSLAQKTQSSESPGGNLRLSTSCSAPSPEFLMTVEGRSAGTMKMV